jgi:UDP-N-acetylmuramate dehydrogenase
MELASEIQTLFPGLPVRKNQSLGEFTTFRLGGPCPLLIDNPSAARLPALIRFLDKNEIPFLVIGQGSNLVISDKGLDCVIIRFCSDTPAIQLDGSRITVSGNTLLEDFARITVEQNLGDLSYCTGIPGTVGGGIAGNAGAFGRQIGDHLVSAEIIDLDGDVQIVTHSQLEFAYRHSKLKETGEIVLSAIFELPLENKDIMRRERERIIEFRKEHHPDWHTMPCAGSVFRNIEASSAAERRKAAGHFLEEAGAKNMTVGGAHLFEKHANIIIGGDDCNAQDVWNLSEQMKAAVKEKFGLDLIREVRFLGKF